MTRSDTKLNPLTAFLVRLLLRPKVYYQDPGGKDDILSEPSIVICNHTGHLDGPLVTTVLRKAPIHNLAAKDRFEQWGFGFFLRHTGCIPIDRQKADSSWLHESIRILKEDKENIAIFPEGRHGAYREQLPFQPGAALLAAMSDVPLVMVYVDGPVKIWGKRARLMVSKPFHLDPPSQGLNSEYIQDQTRRLQLRMTDLMQEFIRLER
jgi:1-acyl-sn-glycerol-3-phosphate acyltransferase